MNNRDMFYNSYGYSSGFPLPNMIYNPNMQYQNNSPFTDIDNRLTRIEKQINRLNQRITRLESPNNTNIYNEPDNSLYMI